MTSMSSPEESQPRRWPYLIPLFALTVMIILFGERWLRRILLYLSGADWARQTVSALPPAQRVAARFVAGADRESALRTAAELNAAGMTVTLDFLGESVSSAFDAAAARKEITQLVERVAASEINAGVSIKLTQLGLRLGESVVEENLCAILETAQRHNIFVRIDMENSPVVDATLSLYQKMRNEHGFTNTGVVIQSYLYRSEHDVERLIQTGASIRLCKGAYAEPPEVAFPHKVDTDASFIHLAQRMFSAEARANGVYPAFATHDAIIIDEICRYTTAHDIPVDQYEFQMLYGIRRDLQESLVRRGYRMRVYVPYGTAWYPYFVRRLAERPANLWFFISNFIKA
jgi:proline dehydrogenase